MRNFICTTCGTQYAESVQPPAACAICQDERQYVKATGQQWTTPGRLRLTNRNSVKFKEPGLIGVGIDPHLAIGQRALFLRTAKNGQDRHWAGSGPVEIDPNTLPSLQPGMVGTPAAPEAMSAQAATLTSERRSGGRSAAGRITGVPAHRPHKYGEEGVADGGTRL
jgi:hypothetical protein